MKISAKGRYALSAMICLAQEGNADEYITIISISKKLGISKIYLEQVFALLKKANLVQSTKGSGGGYKLMRNAEKITVFDILKSTERTLFEKAAPSLSEGAQSIEKAVNELVNEKIDNAITGVISKVTLNRLKEKAAEYGSGNIMYYI